MKWRTLALATAIGAAAVNASAATITYSTLGRFNGGAFSSSPTLTVGGASMTFNALGSTSVDPGNLSFGTFDSNAIGSGGTIPVGTTFDLQIVQTTPMSGTGVLSATLSGMISTTSSSVRLIFGTTSLSIGGVAYNLDQPLSGIAIVSPSSNAGLTTIQGSASEVPEPSSAALVAGPLLGLGILGRRRAA